MKNFGGISEMRHNNRSNKDMNRIKEIKRIGEKQIRRKLRDTNGMEIN